MQTLVTEIQRFSLHDGPGIRTTVFLKGCPLHCVWCHNPECISFEEQTLFYPQKCIGCGRCDEGCYAGAKERVGRAMTPAEVFAEVLRDAPYYGDRGGVTLSGGEPLAHPEFVRELLSLCRERGIRTAMETTLYRYDAQILSLVDYLMCDVKIFDSARHHQYTGFPNEEILANIRRADSLGIPILVRTPVIVGINDDEENIRNTRDFLSSLNNVVAYELLPYHPLGVGKARALGMEQTEFAAPDKEAMERLKEYAKL